MSHTINSSIMDEAREWADVYVDTTLGNALENAIQKNDLEGMYHLIGQARQLEKETWSM